MLQKREKKGETVFVTGEEYLVKQGIYIARTFVTFAFTWAIGLELVDVMLKSCRAW